VIPTLLQPTENSRLGRNLEILIEDKPIKYVGELFGDNVFAFLARFNDFARTVEAAIGPQQFFLSETGWMGLAPVATVCHVDAETSQMQTK
jgi:hypothetical protein